MSRLTIAGLISLAMLLSFGFAAAAVPAATSGAGCQWLLSPNGAGNYQPLYADPDATPIEDLRFGEPYSPIRLLIAGDGYLDFNDDNRADVFRTTTRTDGLLQWQFSSGGAGAWQNLAYAGTPLADLRFGDFNGDGKTDVFTAQPGAGGYRWLISSGGVGNYTQINTSDVPLSDLRFGDFDGDGKTDVFSVALRPDGFLQWRYSSAGVGTWQNLAYAGTPLQALRFGDFDGDGKTDVFTSSPLASGAYQWYYSSGASGSYIMLAADSTQLSDLRFGDFDGDFKTDVFRTTTRSDGLLQWQFSSGGTSAWQNLAYAGTPLANLRIGYFNAGSIADLLAVPCGSLPSRRGFPQPFADRVLGQKSFTTSGAGTSASTLHGPAALAIAPNGRLFVADYKNNRVLSWPDAVRFHSGDTADLVIGQPDFTSGGDNRGNGSVPGPNSLWGPESLAIDLSGRLFVADTTNHRVLIFDGPFTPGAHPSASVVLGQPSFTTPGTGFGGCAAPANANFCYARGLAFDSSGRLYAIDEYDHRVLVFDPPFHTGQLASHVIGQPDFTSAAPNWFGPAGAPQTTPSAYGLSGPRGLAIDSGDRLFVADSENNRVLVFNTPLVSSPAANDVLGQPNFASGAANQGKANPSVYGFNFPIDLAFDTAGHLFVSDLNNHRVVNYTLDDGFTGASYERFGYVQNYGECGSEPDPDPAPTRIGLRCPLGLAVNPFGGLLIADFYNNRVLAFDVPIQQAYIPLAQR